LEEDNRQRSQHPSDGLQLLFGVLLLGLGLVVAAAGLRRLKTGPDGV